MFKKRIKEIEESRDPSLREEYRRLLKIEATQVIFGTALSPEEKKKAMERAMARETAIFGVEA